MKYVLAAPIVVLILAAHTVYTVFFNALALWQLWQWFVMPLGLPDLTGWHLAGISLIAGYMTWKQPPKSDDNREEAMMKTFLYPPLLAGVYVFVGWVIITLFGIS